MAEVTFRVRIPAGKNTNDKATKRFVRVYPNTTADPLSEDFVPGPAPDDPGGISDEDWLKKRTRQWLNDTINLGAEHETRENNPPPRDDEIVDR